MNEETLFRDLLYICNCVGLRSRWCKPNFFRSLGGGAFRGAAAPKCFSCQGSPASLNRFEIPRDCHFSRKCTKNSRTSGLIHPFFQLPLVLRASQLILSLPLHQDQRSLLPPHTGSYRGPVQVTESCLPLLKIPHSTHSDQAPVSCSCFQEH